MQSYLHLKKRYHYIDYGAFYTLLKQFMLMVWLNGINISFTTSLTYLQ